MATASALVASNRKRGDFMAIRSDSLGYQTTNQVSWHYFRLARDPGTILRGIAKWLRRKSLLRTAGYTAKSCQLHFRTTPRHLRERVFSESRRLLRERPKLWSSAYLVRPMRRRRSSKRGSLRSGSSRGSTPTEGIQSERSRYAFASQAKAWSLSPSTE